ncbi:ribosome biogenesis GTPase YlqF [Pseudoflavonifractor phocaeensis]|uniref:ribosome biogenesis GTPase YlqF n=1 Tax=Pseudoflavonifractor phocaeensis TaxID=1870988 RepID=UPI001EFFA6A7|nr:ribosome biogenesis GTPase YlqF [Pseudoflavonifractor phocaeensis]MCF2661062.1 ribosome biogenesis GTPase YlqF [Pseudoflavonifractor phocaeensis]
MNIQWYPGHMTKTRRQIEADLKNVDMVVEIIDARIPVSSRNPDIDAICAGKPRLIVLNRADQADPAMNRRWAAFFKAQGHAVLETDAKTGKGVNQFSPLIQEALKEQIARWREKGQVGRPVRAMVVGVPNVGKSTFINKVARKKSALAGDRPGVTRGKQWVNVDQSLDLLDTPGILWPKFEDVTTGMHLAFTGAVKDDIMDVETLGCHLMTLMSQRYPEALKAGYKLAALPEREEEENDVAYGYRLLEACAQKRGMRISGGEFDTERMARVLLDEYRGGKLGRFTLEAPAEADQT